MKTTFKSLILGGFLLSIVMVSCKKDNDNTPLAGQSAQTPVLTSSLSGLGGHGGLPSGTAYTLPPNIKIIGSMCGGMSGYKLNNNYSKTEEIYQQYYLLMPKSDYTYFGYGTFVNIYMKLYNMNNKKYELIIPAGTIMCKRFPTDSTDTDSTQSGIIIYPDTIPIPGEDTVNVVLKSFCLNHHHGVPNYQDKYEFKVVTNNEQLQTVVGILRNKKTIGSHTYQIQSILWHISDGNGLTQDDINTMNSWQ